MDNQPVDNSPQSEQAGRASSHVAPSSPELGREAHGKKWLLIGLVAIFFVLALLSLADGPATWNISSASSQASNDLTSQAAQIEVPKPVISASNDQKCQVTPPTEFGSFTSTIICTYYYHAFAAGSGNQSNDFKQLVSRIQSAGFQPYKPLTANLSDTDFHMGSEQLNTEFIPDENSVSLAGLGDDNFAKLAAGKLPKNNYLYGYTIADRYVQGTCIVCLGFKARSHIFGQLAHPMVVPPVPATRTISFPVYFPNYMPPNFTFNRFTKPGRWLGIYYDRTGVGDKTGFLEFPVPTYYNPPTVCGDGAPDGEMDACQELFVTPGGKALYKDTPVKNELIIYAKLDTTLAVFYTGGFGLGQPRGTDDVLNGGTNVLTASQVASLPSNSMEAQLAKIFDSLSPATAGQLQQINKSPNWPNYGNPGGF